MRSFFVWVVAAVVVVVAHASGHKRGYEAGFAASRVQFLVPSEDDVLRALVAPTLAPMPVFPPSSELVHQSSAIPPAPEEKKQ